MNPQELTYSNDLTLAMQSVLNQQLKGKKFVYRSKWGGETFGEIAEVGVSKSITWDRDTTQNFQNSIDYTNDRMYGRISRNTPAPEKIEVKNYYSAYTFSIRIKSTNNITYIMGEDNVYILNN